MTLEQSFAFLTFALVAAITPGPSNVMITATGSTVGVLRGLPCVLGASVGMASLLFCTALGLGQLVVSHPLALKVMNLLGATFLLWLAWNIGTAGRPSEAERQKRVGFTGAALFQWANPKGWLVAVGAAGTYLHAAPGNQLTQALAFGALFFVAAFPSGLVWLGLGALLQRALRSDRTARIFNGTMGVALVGSVLLMFL